MEVTIKVAYKSVVVTIGKEVIRVKKNRYGHATITINGEYIGSLKRGVLRLVFVRYIWVCKDDVGNVDIDVVRV